MSGRLIGDFVSSPCVADRHGECRHVHGDMQCQCACHSNCPARSASAGQDAEEICTCPGRTSRREELNKGSGRRGSGTAEAPSVLGVIKMMGSSYRGTKARRDGRKEAEELVSSTARGKPIEEIRARLLTEYARRGVLPRPEPLFDNLVRLMITDDPNEKAMLLKEQRQIALAHAEVIGGQMGRLRHLFSELQEDEDGDEEEEGNEE